MSDTNLIFDVDAQHFSQQVIQRSHEVPVVVDFWAAWCGPCQMLMPLLHRLAEEYQGKFLLAKVNSDEQQALAGEYGVRSLPTVKIFKNGEVVDEFMGAQAESMLREIIDRHIPRASDAGRAAAQRALQAGDTTAALQQLMRASETDPDNHDLQLELAEVQVQCGDTAAANEILGKLPLNIQESERARSLQTRIRYLEIGHSAPDVTTLQQRITDDPADLEARYQLASHYLLAQDHAAALEQMFEIMKRDRGFRDDIGRRGMLDIFELLGHDHELVAGYRRKMAALLY
jgi:putative thioredoxin